VTANAGTVGAAVVGGPSGMTRSQKFKGLAVHSGLRKHSRQHARLRWRLSARPQTWKRWHHCECGTVHVDIVTGVSALQRAAMTAMSWQARAPMDEPGKP
jgi:hypothetical protein